VEMDASTRAALIALLLDLLKQLIAELLIALRELRQHEVLSVETG